MLSAKYSVFCFWILYHVDHGAVTGAVCDVIMDMKVVQVNTMSTKSQYH